MPRESKEFTGAAVIGAGTTGSGIAQVLARAGLPTTLYDVDDAAGRGSVRSSTSTCMPGSSTSWPIGSVSGSARLLW